MKVNTLSGKSVKDYTFSNTIVVLQGESEVVLATKGEKQIVTVYVLKKEKLNSQLFVEYNKILTQNILNIFPRVIQLIQSQKNIYIIFESVIRPCSPIKDINSALLTLKNINLYQNSKISKDQIFMRNYQQFCYIPSFFKDRTSSNLYSKFHNKSLLISIFIDIVPNNNKNGLNQALLKEWDTSDNLQKVIKPFLIQQQYPNLQSDDTQIMQLMSVVRVNPTFKQQAQQQFQRTSSRKNDNHNNQQMSGIFQIVKKSMFKIELAKDQQIKKSKYSLKIEQIKQQQAQFKLYYQTYTESFKFLKKVIKSYLAIYSKGYAGIIASYLLTLIGILRRLQLICDLQQKKDIFTICFTKQRTFNNQIAGLKKQLLAQGKILVNLKTIIENSSMPQHTFQTLMPYLQKIQSIDKIKIQDFCFFYMTILFKQKDQKIYHSLLVIETLLILINRNYQIIYVQQDFPKKWDQDYFQLRKTLIEISVPHWSID